MVRIGTPPAARGRAILASMTGTLPASALDPFSEEFLRDPYPAHEELREAAPAVLLERYGVWAMARHEQVHDALGDWRASPCACSTSERASRTCSTGWLS